MYEMKKRILYSDFDEKGDMQLGRIVVSLQDCINAHSQDIGRGIDYMVKVGRTWFLVAWNIEIHRKPKLYEDVTLATWGYDYKMSSGHRNVTMKDAEGKICVCADSLWSLVDMETGKPIRITEADMEGYVIAPRAEDMTYLPRKIKYEGDFLLADTVHVRRADIDYNGHMTNANYIALACEYIPEDFKVNRIRGEYKAQSKYLERLNCYTCFTEEKCIVRIVGEADNEEKCVVEFT